MTQRVLITGAASGLGAALTRALRERGDEVLDTDRTGTLVTLDITSAEDWDRVRDHVLATWGGLDLLINNAGVATGGRIDAEGEGEWERILDINLMGAVRGIKAFTPILKAQGSGHIVNVASLAGLVHPAGMAAYCASKAAVVALSESLRFELGVYGVRVSVVCPSYFRSGLADQATGADAGARQVIAKLVTQAARGADEIAAAALAALDAGEDLILPDPDARAAVALKQSDPATYAAVMADQARKLKEQG